MMQDKDTAIGMGEGSTADGLIGVYWRDGQRLWEIRYRINGVEEVKTRHQRAAAYRLAERVQKQIKNEGAKVESFVEDIEGADHRQDEFWLDLCGSVARKLAANPGDEELHRLARVVGGLAGNAKKYIPNKNRDPSEGLGTKSDSELAEAAVRELSGLVSQLPEDKRAELAAILLGKEEK